MRYGLDIAQHQLDWTDLMSRVRSAEDAGFDGAWVFDHFQALYGDPGGPCLEGWSLLGALASATTRLRLGALVTGVTYRHPSVLAAQAVTVDVISGGRLEMAMGAAWNEREHRQLGIPFPPIKERAGRLEEAVQVIRLLMTTDEAQFEGAHYRLRGASYHPRPVQQPHPPIWIGARGEKLMLPIVARQADVWHTNGPVDTVVARSHLLDDLAERAGRDPGSIERATDLSLSEPWEEVVQRVRALDRAGFSYLTVGWPTEGQQRLEEFVEKILPDLPQS